MSFLVFFAVGVLGGILGGMGMGGGTALIPLLTLACGVEQTAAQGINLLAFLPMSLFALGIHARNGLLETRGLWQIALPALLLSALFSFFAAQIPSLALRRLFGAFLTVLSFFRLRACFVSGTAKKV